MSHIPDGTIHAWLDGAASFDSAAEEDAFYAHFEICEDCRGRLQEARRIREEAQTILSDAGPGTIAQPAFSELQKRAKVRVQHERAGDTDAEVAVSVSRAAKRGGTGSGGASKRSRRLPLAWAASIVMALGAGWFGSRILQESPVLASRQVAQSDVAESDLAQSDLARLSDADAPVGAAASEQDAFADEASVDLVRGGEDAAGRDAKVEDLRAQPEEQLRQLAASPEAEGNELRRREAFREVGQAAGQEGLQEGEAAALQSLEKRGDDVADAVAGNRPLAEQAPAAVARQVPAGAAAPARDALAGASKSRAVAAAGQEPASCFALAADGWTAPFELPAVITRPAGGSGEQDGASVAWTTLADNSVRISWRSGDQTLLLTMSEAAGNLEGSAAAWLESDAALSTRGPVRLSPTACP
ncbi:MAG: hypothetical protein ABFS14_03355 [Gemmatimonadota bacterium]